MAQKSDATFFQSGNLRAGCVDAAVSGHKKLHGLDLAIAAFELTTVMHVLVCEIFNGVGQDLKRAAGIAIDTATTACVQGVSRHARRGGLKQEAGGRSRCHVEILLTQFFDLGKFFFI
jgi:hypothetical protein